MKKTRILAALLAGMTILGTVACGSADDSADAYISASSSAEKYVEFLKTRLGDDVDGTITLALADKSGEKFFVKFKCHFYILSIAVILHLFRRISLYSIIILHTPRDFNICGKNLRGFLNLLQ